VFVRLLAWVLVNAGLITVCLSYSAVAETFDANGVSRVILGVSMGLLGLLSVFLFPQSSQKKGLFLLLVVSLLPRLALLPAAPSDDVNRYLWEGKLTELGVNPYQAVADDPMYDQYHDEYWEALNHRDRPTAYPPLAMQVFRVVNGLAYSPMSYKVVALLLDMLLIATLLALLRHYFLPQRWVLFYAFSPLSLLSYAAEGHFDIFMVLALALALLAHAKRWWGVCGAAVAVAVGVKIMAAVVVPLLLWRSGRRGWLVAALVFFLPLVFYWESLGSVGHALFLFGSGGGFNGPVHQLLSWILSPNYQLASMMVALLYIVCWLFAFWLMLKQRLWSAVLVALGALVLLSPIVHFWYLTWILPIIALRPKFSWALLSITCCLYFLVWDHQERGLGWAMPLWAKWVFWTPFAFLFIAENRKFLSKLKSIKMLDKKEKVGFSMIIPTYNPGENLQNAVNSIAAQSLLPREIILSDADSSDGSITNLDTHGLNIREVRTKLGRGEQIKAGVENAEAEWVVILHSDGVLPEEALSRLSEALERNPTVIGGSLGQRFTDSSPSLLMIEVMNEFRAVLMQTSFGDQTQFFHRNTALSKGVLTEQPLMEDVEMSDRLNALGDTLYLGVEGGISARKWLAGHFWKRFLTVIGFCLRYRIFAYTREQRSALSHEFYKRYYRS